MNPAQKAELIRQGGKLVGDLVKVAMSRPKKVATESAESTSLPATAGGQPLSESQHPTISLPTTEETATELKRRLARELYKAELDLSGGLKIAGKPCDCLDHKHTLFLEAAAEELISQDPSNPVYSEIIQWVKDNQHKVTVEAIHGGVYKSEYPKMASQFKDFRKRVMGTAAFSAMGEPPQTITLEEAKKLAAEEAEKEIERKWHLAEKKPAT